MEFWKPTIWPTRASVILIDLYRHTLRGTLGGQCRFYPSCSQYSRLAFLKYGFFKGLSKSIYRILRCHPLHAGGVDEP